MGIVMQPSATQQTVETAVNQNKVMDYRLAQQIYQGIVRSYNFVWKNRQYSPAQILAQYGTDATALFTYCTQAQNLVAPLLGDQFKPLGVPDEYDVVFNQDGSVTLSLKPVTPA